MAGISKSFVYRVSDLPLDKSESDFQSQLSATIQRLLTDKEKERLKVIILYIPSCDSDDTSCALLEFKGGQPEFLSDLHHDPLSNWQVEMGDVDINIDQHFFGFTQLYNTPPKVPITADIIAIARLDGHAYGSWRGKDNLRRMWLRDFLSKDLPHCRTMIYGYNSKLSSHGVNTIMDYGRNFLEGIKRVRNSKEARERPLVFIAHSFGGIILAHCLVKAVQADERDHPTIASLRKATYAILFFGTPHKGMIIDDIQRMVMGNDCHPRLDLTQQIKLKSDLLTYQLTDIKNLTRDLEIISFYETQQTRRLEFDEETKTWGRTGAYITVVDSEPALLQLPDSMETKVNVDADHSLMAQFDSRSNATYKTAIGYLKQFERDAQKIIPSRFTLPAYLQKKISPASTVPFSKDKAFIERLDAQGQNILNNLASQFAQPNTHKRLALVGLGGIGKSQLAIEYSYRAREKDSQLWVFWVYATNVQKFEQSYKDIAANLQLPGWNNKNSDILGMVSRWMSDVSNGQWLIILDNADDINALHQVRQEQPNDNPIVRNLLPLWSYIPQTTTGSVLVTTRDKGAAQFLCSTEGIIHMKNMDRHEALQLLSIKLNGTSEPTISDSEELVKELEYIPLAITQAAAYISVEAPIMTVSRFLAFYRQEENQGDLLDQNLGDLRRDQNMPNSVIRTWQISFDQIKRNTVAAADLLSLMAVFDRQGTPQFLLCSQEQSNFNFHTALSPLMRFSLVIMENDGQTFQMRRLVQLATRKWLELNNDMAKWREKAIVLLSARFPYAHYENWKTCRNLLPHASEGLRFTSTYTPLPQTLERATLLYNMASYNFKRGKFETALLQSQESLSLRQQLLHKDHEDILYSMHTVAEVLFEQGYYEEAENRFRQVIEMRKIIIGCESPDTLASMASLAKAFSRRSRLKDAEGLALQVVDIRKRIIGEEHPETLSSISYLAMLYLNQGRLEEAEELGLQVLDLQKRILGDEHPDTLTTMGYLASMYRDQCRWNEAEKLGLQVLNIYRRIMGEEYPETLIAMGSLAITYTVQWRWKEAEKLFAGPRSPQEDSRSRAPDHPEKYELPGIVIL